MELRNLKTFIRAAELNSFSQAAAQLGYVQSTVTAQIDALEQELGVELFTRSGKRIALSTAGADLLQYAYQLRTLEEQISCHFSGDGEPAGSLHIGILESIAASPRVTMVSRFLQRYPQVRMKVTIATTLQLMEMLRKGQLDLALLFDQPVCDPNFCKLYFKKEPVLFFAAPDHRLLRRPSVRLADLTEENWLLTEKGCNYRKLLEDEIARRGLYLRDRLEIGSTRAIIDFTAASLGISLLPAFDLADDLAKGAVSQLPLTDYTMEMELQILIAKNRWLSPVMETFCAETAALLQLQQTKKGR